MCPTAPVADPGPMNTHGSEREEAGPQTLVGMAFDSLFRAQEFLIAARGLAAAGRLELKDAVTDRIRDALESPAEPERDVRSSDPV